MTNLKSLYLATLILASGAVVTSCNDDYDDVKPGSYVSTERIETFPGDTVVVSGTVSNNSPIENVVIECAAWNINETYDRTQYSDNVFNYEYQLVVPTDAQFNQTLTITATCDNGQSTVREIPISYLPDTNAPVITSVLNAQQGLDFDPQTSNATYSLSFNVADDRNLASAEISIPAINIEENIPLSGRTATITKELTFTTVGTYPCTITIKDADDNANVSNIEFMVMLAEVENPFQDYAGMYVVDANENPNDYLDGYYRYMDRQGEYQYQGTVYAATDNAKFLFTPERTLDGDLFGVSPIVNSKLMNNNGYVVPITIDKAGYYGVWIDLNAHSYSVWALDIPTTACTEDIWLSGTGFAFGDWGATAEPMTRNGYRYTQTTELVSGHGDIQYYFYTSGWARVFRGDADGRYWYEAASGGCVTFQTPYSGPVLVTYDSAFPWGTIKKAN